MKLIKALSSLLVLLALAVGVPALLVWLADPLVLLQVQWPSALLRPDDGTVIVGVLGLIGWIAWAFLMLTVLMELANVVSRGAIRISLPGTHWLQPALNALVVAAMAPVMGFGATASHAAPVTPEATTPLVAALPANDPATSSPAPARSNPKPPQPVNGSREYIVQAGDELWSIAESQLGAGQRWREIVALNEGLEATASLSVGQVLHLPATPEPTSPEPTNDPSDATAQARTLTVEAGDTLWDLADEHLGDPQRWDEIHAANSDLITDPDEIDIGWTLAIPANPRSPETGTDPGPTTSQASTDSGTADPSPDPSPDPDSTDPDSTETASPPDGDTEASESTSDQVWIEEVSEPEISPEESAIDVVTASPEADPTSMLGPIGAVLAAGIVTTVASRRRLRMLHRAVGTRLKPYSASLHTFISALGRRAQLAPSSPPHEAGPTSVLLGHNDYDAITTELEVAKITTVSGPPQLCSGFTAAILTALMCHPASATVTVTAIAPDQRWDQAFDDPRLEYISDIDDGIAHLHQLISSRRIAMRNRSLHELRNHPDFAEVFAPHVVVLSQAVNLTQWKMIQDHLASQGVGVSVVAPITSEVPLQSTTDHITLLGQDRAEFGETPFTPQLLTQPARRALIELFSASLDPTCESAPWWHNEPLPPNVSPLPRRGVAAFQEDTMPPWRVPPAHPTLLLLGEVELVGTRGTQPTRAISQCTEYCAWLLNHSEATASQMCKDLMVAEPTRRSNVSRLRSWLGSNDDGELYLPEAYSGKLQLHEDVTSDWERFTGLLAGGVNMASTSVLEQALSLVRGAPLTNVAFQWPWAEQMRSDMLAMITDATIVLVQRCLEHGDLSLAAWGLQQGRLAVGEDETLTVQEIELFAITGERASMDKTIRRLTRTARSEGRDLAPETAARIQQALNLANASEKIGS